jgi:hypothetical protein
MAKESQYRPDLHEPALQLIRRIVEEHAAGVGQIGLLEIVELFGATLKPDEEAKLRKRGDLLLRPETESRGRFENRGGEVKFSKSGITVTVPSLVAGTYRSRPDGVHLAFDRDSTIYGGVLFFRVKLEEIRVDEERIDIHLTDDDYNQSIIHRPTS